MTKLTELQLDEHNANLGTERGKQMLKDSLLELKAGRSILLDAQNRVIAGNKTVQAAVEVGIEDVQIVESDGSKLIAVKRTDLDLEKDGKARRLAYADNRVGEIDLSFSPEQIAADLEAGVDLSGLWTDMELKELLSDLPIGEAGDAEPQTNRADELREQWGVESGQLWKIAEHRLLCGDSTKREDVERVMGGERAGAVVTDSPYGIEREGIENDDPEGLRGLFDGVLAAMPIDNAVVINFQSPRLFPVWLDAIRAAGHKVERALWMYDENDQTKPWHYWLMCSQIAIISSLGKPEWQKTKAHHDTYVIGLSREWRAGGDGNDFPHASVKPVGVIQDMLSHIGGDVYDPFGGSGTTMIAAQNLGRKCFMVDISPAYVAVTLQRMLDAFGIRGELVE